MSNSRNRYELTQGALFAAIPLQELERVILPVTQPLDSPDVARTREIRAILLTRLYCRMLADGLLISKGWRICERVETRGQQSRYACWPVAPE
jgi:hypothetical protein